MEVGIIINKHGWGAKFAKSLNVEVGINMEVGIFFEKSINLEGGFFLWRVEFFIITLLVNFFIF